MRERFVVATVLLLAACPADSTPGGSGTDTSGGVDPTSPGTSSAPPDPNASGAGTSTGEPPADSSGDPPPTDSGSSDSGGSGSSDDGGGPPPVPMSETPCGNTVYECGDLVDNDGDGFIDLYDPECTGPCDDDENSFATGIPGDNSDCKQDCFFDGNSGSGNDGCVWDLVCDPSNPGANIGCEYNPGANCNNSPPNQSAECIAFCSQLVPAGCDCFGCCTVELDDGTSVDIFLGSGEDCSLSNLDGCQTCTSQIDDCGNPCEPDMCEVCFGEIEPPPGCGMQNCDNDMPCMFNEDCPTDFFCYQGCCFPPPPG